MSVSVGQIYRDKVFGNEKRTIRITELLPNVVLAVVVTDNKGNAPIRYRTTTIMFSTLRAGYTLAVDADQKAAE
jgi:hypothetical protein